MITLLIHLRDSTERHQRQEFVLFTVIPSASWWCLLVNKNNLQQDPI